MSTIHTQFKMLFGIKTMSGELTSLRPQGVQKVRIIRTQEIIATHLLDTFSEDDPSIEIIKDRSDISRKQADRP